jgi:hypothetical protein
MNEEQKKKYFCKSGFTCEVCGIKGLLQIISKNYARVRHYSHLNPETKRPLFIYHRQSMEYINKVLGTIDLKDQKTHDPNNLKSPSINEMNSGRDEVFKTKMEKSPANSPFFCFWIF